MDGLQGVDLDLIVWMQQFATPGLDAFFKGITFMGEETFFLLAIPFVWWCVETRTAVRLALAVLLSACLNVYLKAIFQAPRPFEIAPGVQRHPETGAGMPSGHAQTSVVFWGTLAHRARRKWAWSVAVALMALIGLSRAYLGVHFPTQVLAGGGVGIIMLGALVGLTPRLEAWVSRQHLGQTLLLAVTIPVVLLLIQPAPDTISATGVMLGMGLGLIVAHRLDITVPLGPWWQRLLRYAVGMAVVLGLYFGLSRVFPGPESPVYVPFRVGRYALVGVWVSLGAPWLFSRWRAAIRLRPRPTLWLLALLVLAWWSAVAGAGVPGR